MDLLQIAETVLKTKPVLMAAVPTSALAIKHAVDYFKQAFKLQGNVVQTVVAGLSVLFSLVVAFSNGLWVHGFSTTALGIQVALAATIFAVAIGYKEVTTDRNPAPKEDTDS